MEQSIFISAQEVADMLGISKSKAYRIVRELNEELETKGFITVAGKVSRKFFEEKFYGAAGSLGSGTLDSFRTGAEWKRYGSTLQMERRNVYGSI